MARERDDEYADEYEDDRPRPRRGRAGRARELVSGPAVGLIVAGALSILAALFNGVQIAAGLNEKQFADARKQFDDNPGMNPQAKAQAKQMMDTYEQITQVAVPVTMVLYIASGVVTILGGVRMKNLSNKTLATTGAVVAMIPCIGGCCIVGLPIGIWALVTLGKPEVKAGFAANARSQGLVDDTDVTDDLVDDRG